MSRKSSMRTWRVSVVYLVSGLLMVSVVLNIWLLLQRNIESGGSSTKGFASHPKCLENGFLKKEKFLAHYTVGNNETLQSIAEIQLHDKSRTHEIYFLNEEQLVRLGFGENVVLPEGMTLLIPPEEARFSSANVVGVEGRIVKVTNDSFIVSPKTGLTISIYTDPQTKLERNFKAGDCVEAIYYGDNSNRAVWISPQT